MFIVAAVFIIASCNQDSSGRKKTSTGYEYEIYAKGSGEKAQKGDYLKFSFEVIGSDSSLIQASLSPANYPVIQLPKEEQPGRANPIIDVFNNAQVGDSMAVYMPIDSMQQAAVQYGHLEYMKYIICIKSIMNQEAFDEEQKQMRAAEATRKAKFMAKEAEVADIVASTLKEYKKNKLQLTTLDSGLKYYVHEQGDGAIAKKGDNASVMYYGVLVEDGTEFDNSYKKGSPFNVQADVGQVIKGWDQALTTLPSGTKASLFIPSDLAYGANGRPGIPGGAELMFYIDIQ